LDLRLARLASGLLERGVTADGIALLLRNDIPFSEASCAAQTFGACALPINWHFKADEIA